MVNYLENLILNNWNKWVGVAKPEKLDFLKTHAGQATRNKKVGFFVFANKKPIIFVKTVRKGKYNKVIEDGFEKLESIYKILNDGSVPKPIYLGKHQGIIFSLETAIRGKQFHSCKKQSDLKKFLKWLFEFQKLMRENKEIILGSYLDNLLAGFFELYKTEKVLEDLIKELALEIKKEIVGLKVFSVRQHGDLTPDNVINDRGKIKVIDWDNFDNIDLPSFDLLVFLQRWSGIRDISFIHEYPSIIERYFKEFNIDKQALKSLVFSYYLLDFLRKKKELTNYDKQYLKERLKEIKEL